MKMDSGTLSDAKFTEFAAANFELVRIEKSQHPAEFERLKVAASPEVIILDTEGKEVGRIAGDPGPAELRKQLEATLAKLDSSQS